MKKFLILLAFLAQSWLVYGRIPLTPTPAQTAVLCGNPFPQVFVQNPTPILVAATNYEGGRNGAVVEPNVIIGPDGLLHMTYTGNAFYINNGVETICLATASDPAGPWTRHGPIIGGGACGDPNAAGQSSQLHIGNEYRIYFSDEAHKWVYYATSTDGYNYTLVGYPGSPVMKTADFQPPCTGAGGELDGMGIFTDGSGNYWSIAEIKANECPVDLSYALWLCKGNSNATSFTMASSVNLESLAYYNGKPILGIDNLAQGGRATVLYNGVYYTFYGVGYPTNIYGAESYDLYNWYVFSANPLIFYTSHTFGLESCNQVCDVSFVEYKGNCYLFYDGTDNKHGTARIGYSEFYGSLAQYAACQISTPIPTSTPQIAVLVVGGGGGGGVNDGGGGGAGGYLYNGNFIFNQSSYAVTVGSGGAGGNGTAGSNGSDSIFSDMDAAGGGGGAGLTAGQPATSGGCGGGGSALVLRGSEASATQGSGGGNGYYYGSCFAGGGGGGAAWNGTGGNVNVSSCVAGYGGTGTASNITGSIVYYGGGGGGGGYQPKNCKNGLGGQGGGGDGGYDANSNGGNGKANTGGGGGGAAGGTGKGGNGGSGIVIISYLTSLGKGSGGTITYNGTHTVHTFTSNGIFVPPKKILRYKNQH